MCALYIHSTASGLGDHQYNHLMKMYTDEAMKSSK